jgi:hypothetical protein
MKLWIDDERPAPNGWYWAETSADAIEWIERMAFSEVSFDHDLGGDDTTRKVVLWMLDNNITWPPIVRVHTANPVGREWLEGMINRYGPGVTR